MLYISAQPAEQYFLWQLEIQLQNFEDIGILPENIHVVLSYSITKGIPLDFEQFTQENHQAQFFFYPDKRIKSNYLSSIRPHILSQHFKKFPDLTDKTVCYHDSDILFRERLDESLLAKTPFWYFSDTRNYVSSDYLKSYGNEFFNNLCKAANIDPELVEKNKINSGGAQHIMKGVNETFWEDVELYSEVIFTFIDEFNKTLKYNSNKVQVWCADMWALLWTSWKLGKEVRLHSELDFSWPKEHISKYYQSKILHNAGVFTNDKNNYFCKLIFKESNPYHIDFSHIKNNLCSIKYIEQIYRISQTKQRIFISDCTIIINLKSPINSFNQTKLKQYIDYLYKHIDIEIHILEQSIWPVFNQKLIEGKAKHFLICNRTIDRHIKNKVKTDHFIYLDANILLPVDNILSTLDLLRTSNNTLVYPMDEISKLSYFQYDEFKDTLTKGLERKIFAQEKKLIDHIEGFAMKKKEFINCGGSNLEWSFFYEEGFNLERQIRCRLLGLNIKKIEQSAFKLFSVESRPDTEIENSAEKYLKTSAGNKDDIIRKIAHCDYGFNKPYAKRARIENLSLGICALKEHVDLISIKNTITENTNIKEIQIDYNRPFHLIFNEIIRKSKHSKFDFIILVNENIVIENKQNASTFWNTIEEMNLFGLQLISAINEGNFKNEKKLNKNLFHVKNFPNSPVFIIHKSIFNKILLDEFTNDKPLENYLNYITDHVGMIVPFLGKPKHISQNDEKYTQSYLHRIKRINSIECELEWKLENQ